MAFIWTFSTKDKWWNVERNFIQTQEYYSSWYWIVHSKSKSLIYVFKAGTNNVSFHFIDPESSNTFNDICSLPVDDMWGNVERTFILKNDNCILKMMHSRKCNKKIFSITNLMHCRERGT